MACNGYFKKGNNKNPYEYYNRVNEYNQILDMIEDGEKVITIRGFRRVGKSSLTKFTFTQFEMVGGIPNLPINCKIKRTPTKVENEIEAFLQQKDKTKWLRVGLKKLNGILKLVPTPETQIAAVLVEALNEMIKTRWELTKDLLDTLEENEKPLFIGFDEVQQFKDRDWMINFLNSVIEDYSNVYVILNGSERYSLNRYLCLDDEEGACLKERPGIVDLNMFNAKQSIEFLRLGFFQNDIEDIEDHHLARIYDELGGVPGWLRRAGCKIVLEYKRTRKSGLQLDLDRIIDKGIQYALEQASGELKKELLNINSHAQKILKIIVEGKEMSYSSIRQKSGIGGDVTDSVLSTLLDLGYVMEDNGVYTVPNKVIESIVGEWK